MRRRSAAARSVPPVVGHGVVRLVEHCRTGSAKPTIAAPLPLLDHASIGRPDGDLHAHSDVPLLATENVVALCWTIAMRLHSLDGVRRNAEAELARCQSARLLRTDAVILDTETTDLDGFCVEIAIISARTGLTILDTLVDPRAEISPEAAAVHGIAPVELSGAPTWPQIAAEVRAAISGRTVLAYNAQFDRAVLDREFTRAGLIAPAARWQCLAELRRRREGSDRRRRLDGGHRALGDCHSAREVLMSAARAA
ncbi:3'-5' exonuclease [Gordonia malaquae]|uniref:3'-5' exonuclease n=1 Tax=Gordonia malaquae TaxID=410332 RepID=UPI003AFAB7C1